MLEAAADASTSELAIAPLAYCGCTDAIAAKMDSLYLLAFNAEHDLMNCGHTLWSLASKQLASELADNPLVATWPDRVGGAESSTPLLSLDSLSIALRCSNFRGYISLPPTRSQDHPTQERVHRRGRRQVGRAPLQASAFFC